MHYEGYWGSVEFSEQDALFFGKVMGVRSLISYEGTTAKALVANFHGAVDDYLDLREQRNETPEKAYRGSFNVRVPRSCTSRPPCTPTHPAHRLTRWWSAHWRSTCRTSRRRLRPRPPLFALQ